MGTSPSEMMSLALAQAMSTVTRDLPVAACLFDSSGNLLASETNRVFALNDPTAHAEILLLRRVGLFGLKVASGLTMAVTLEPCPMCAWAIRTSGVQRLVFGAFNQQYGASGSTLDLLRDGRFGRPVEVIGGQMEEDCKALLDTAFSQIRDN